MLQVYKAYVKFQSPLSRGTTPDELCKLARQDHNSEVSIPSKSGHYSRPSITLGWDGTWTTVSIPSKSGHYSRLAMQSVQPRLTSLFQSPLSRGTTPDTHGPWLLPPRRWFQSPLSRGTTPDPTATIPLHEWRVVSIPSKSGHYSRRRTERRTQNLV